MRQPRKTGSTSYQTPYKKPTYESGCTLPLFAEEKPVRPQATDARQRLQQQLGKPESVRRVARRSHQNSDQTLIGDQERIAEHLSSAMALAESLLVERPAKEVNAMESQPSRVIVKEKLLGC